VNRALITGISGQDGSYLAELLLEKGYAVSGIVRGSPTGRYANLAHIRNDIELMQGDLLDQLTLVDAITRFRPTELYNLAATSFVPASWSQPVMTAQFTAVGVTSMLEAARVIDPSICIYQASSSEIFGAADESPQNEHTPWRPHNPYGVSKLYGHAMVAAYRDRYGMHASSGIVYNHESPRRPPEFVTRKITLGAAAIKLGLTDELVLGDLQARRDWGFSGDFVEAMWLMLQQDEPDDYVIATAVSRTVRELAETAFAYVGLTVEDHVRVDPHLVRPREPVNLVGDPSKARQRLGWEPRTSFEELVRMMVEADLERAARVEDWESLAAPFLTHGDSS
jgi:GDPmannose 4,6-dehydratase